MKKKKGFRVVSVLSFSSAGIAPSVAGFTPLSLSSKNGLLVHINEAYMGNHFESLSLTGQGSFWNTVSEFFAQQIRKILSQSVFTSQTEHIGRIWTYPPYCKLYPFYEGGNGGFVVQRYWRFLACRASWKPNFACRASCKVYGRDPWKLK